MISTSGGAGALNEKGGSFYYAPFAFLIFVISD